MHTTICEIPHMMDGAGSSFSPVVLGAALLRSLLGWLTSHLQYHMLPQELELELSSPCLDLVEDVIHAGTRTRRAGEARSGFPQHPALRDVGPREVHLAPR